jgi:hypothetical protein
MIKQLIQVLAGLLLVALSAPIAQATIITFAYAASGEIGGTVTGTFGYDDSISDTDPSSAEGSYPAAGFF